jgi:hypothetical protein
LQQQRLAKEHLFQIGKALAQRFDRAGLEARSAALVVQAFDL